MEGKTIGILDKLTAGLFGGKTEPIGDTAALAAFMDSRAAFLAQKCVVEFCRVRSGVYWQKLFSEKQFQDELAKSRWRSYPATFSMITEMIEGALRETAGLRRRRLPGALRAVAESTFAKYPPPLGVEADFWPRALGLVEERLEATQAALVRPVREMPDPCARLVFDALPIHKDILTNDYDYIFNNLRMNLLRAHEDFLNRADLPVLVDDLLGPA
jgi:hypothetical protein